MIRVRRYIAFGLLFALAGCGDGAPPSVPVEGVVTLDGKPLAEATVALSPQRATNPGPYSAPTDATGHFVFDGGVAVGDYFVTITTVKAAPYVPEGTPAPPPQKEIVPSAYSGGTMTLTVPAEGAAASNFDIKSK
jgi:hypothetical protein